jgi:hypothetical protein
MGIPDEDLGPQWLRDYGDVDVKVATLLQFGKSLMEELDKDYKPHVEKVFADMSAQDRITTTDFVELADALGRHQTVRMETTTRLARHADGMFAFARIAEAVSNRYDEADAFASARAKDVDTLLAPANPALDNGSVPAGTTSPSGTTAPSIPATGTTTDSGSTYVPPNPEL